VRFLLAEKKRDLAVDLQDGQLDLPEIPDLVLAGRLQQVRLDQPLDLRETRLQPLISAVSRPKVETARMPPVRDRSFCMIEDCTRSATTSNRSSSKTFIWASAYLPSARVITKRNR
jgi:hypothetical protein